MTEQKQIEEMAMSISECNGTTCDNCALKCKAYITCEILYDKDYRKVPDGAVVLTSEERDEEMKEINKTLAERDELKAENERLSAKLGQVLLSIDTVKEMNAMCNIDDHRKQAVKDFAEKVKEHAERSYDWDIAKVVISEVQNVLNTFLKEG